MATITLSPGLRQNILTTLTDTSIVNATAYESRSSTQASIENHYQRLFVFTKQYPDSTLNNGTNVWNWHGYVVDFEDINYNPLVRYSINEITVSVSANGSATYSNFPTVGPTSSGVISFMRIWYGNPDNQVLGGPQPIDMLFTVSDPGGGGEIQLANRTVSGEPFQLSGQFTLVYPGTYNYAA
jgi:hypothetical protein